MVDGGYLICGCMRVSLISVRMVRVYFGGVLDTRVIGAGVLNT